VITRTFKRAVAFLVSTCLVAAGMPARSARAGGVGGESAAPVAGSEKTAAGHFLRDAVASAGFAAQPPDTVTDDFYLPEETDKKKLYRDIAVFVVAAAFVAYFIIKVFIEKDEEPADDGDDGKDVPPPE
jgi:hypothetical protein